MSVKTQMMTTTKKTKTAKLVKIIDRTEFILFLKSYSKQIKNQKFYFILKK
jgi:hypothetical protein